MTQTQLFHGCHVFNCEKVKGLTFQPGNEQRRCEELKLDLKGEICCGLRDRAKTTR